MQADYSHFKQFNKACGFFQTLKPNTDAHYSIHHQGFIVTARGFLLWPGAQTLANWTKGHRESIVEDLDMIFNKNLRFEIEAELETAAKNPEKLKNVVAEFKELKTNFEKAKNGLHHGGLEGLASTVGGQVTVKIHKLVEETEKTINVAIEKLTKFERKESQEVLLTSEGEGSQEIEKLIEEDEELANWLLDAEMVDNEAKEEEESEQAPSMKQMLTYRLTLNYNIAMNALSSLTGWAWWNKIVDSPEEQIYLGAIPIATARGKDDCKTLKDLGVRAVLSVVEPFEMNSPGYFVTPITKERWEKEGITHLQLATADFKTMSFEDIEKGIEFIRQSVKAGLSVYIHCKAGRGRSFLVLACYLIKYHGKSAEEAIAFVKKHRAQAGLENAKLETAIQYEKKCKAMNQSTSEAKQDSPQT